MKNSTLTLPMPLLVPTVTPRVSRSAPSSARRPTLREVASRAFAPSEATQRDKGPKAGEGFEVWHHHVNLRQPDELALVLRLDRRR